MAKIDIISGFLGAGKTTLIQKLLKEALKDCLYIKRNIIERIENLTEDKIMSKDLITLIQDDL